LCNASYSLIHECGAAEYRKRYEQTYKSIGAHVLGWSRKPEGWMIVMMMMMRIMVFHGGGLVRDKRSSSM
jgi:hypothetical protein